MSRLYTLLGSLPDPVILAGACVLFGAGGALIAVFAHRHFFRRWTERDPGEDKLADTAHTSILGFAAFVLALAVTSVFSNMAKVEEAVVLEALDVKRLAREIAGLGPPADAARRALAAYGDHVAEDEWKRLASGVPSLSPRADAALDELWKHLRLLQADQALTSQYVGEHMTALFTRIEQARYSRLASASDSIPGIFWMLIMIFVIAAAIMNGRHPYKRFGMHMIVFHMAAIGLVIALIMIVDNPFRGDTSIRADSIRQAAAI